MTTACIRRGDVPADGWPVLDGQVALIPQRVVLTCTACTAVTEVDADDPRMPDQCCECGGWTWTGELAETTGH